jgi:salicylate synthetase
MTHAAHGRPGLTHPEDTCAVEARQIVQPEEGQSMRYVQLHLPGPHDPLAAAGRLATAASQAGSDYLVYEHPGRRWVIAVDPVLDVSIDNRVLSIHADGHTTTRQLGAFPFAQLRRALIAATPIWASTAYGWVAFEAGHLNHRIATARSHAAEGGPLVRMMVPRTDVRLTSHTAVIRSTSTRGLLQVADLLTAPPVPPAKPSPVPLDADPQARHAFEQRAAAALHRIDGRALSKLVVSRTVPVPYPVDLIGSYLTSRASLPEPAGSFLISYGGAQVTGISPEPLLDIHDELIATQSATGVRSHTGSAQDRLHAVDLLTDPTDLYDHATTLTAARDDLTDLCAPDTLTATEPLRIAVSGGVQQLTTRLHGTLRIDRNAFDALELTVPGLTATGIPRAAACRLISDIEPARGLYGGAVVTADLDTGDLHAALIQRVLIAHPDGTAVLRTGSGLVTGSVPARAHDQTSALLRDLATHITPAEGAIAEAG